MLLCIDIGNSQLCGGVFNGNKLLLQFRYASGQIGSSDQFGIFLRNVITENNLDYTKITKIGISSVVPATNYSMRAACIKYLSAEPVFLKLGVKTGIQVKTHTPNEVGSDLIAGAIAVKNLYPNQDALIFDLGTATTCCFLNRKGEFLGVAIAPGLRMMTESLQKDTAKLFSVEIVKPEAAIGKNTRASIQSGIYYAVIGLIEKLIEQYILETGSTKKPLIIGTGGFSNLLLDHKVFDHIVPELVLLGIKYMLELN